MKCKFAESGKIATIIPIPKPLKDDSNPANDCPTALATCLCKTMERIVNKWLVWFLISKILITNSQCGFRKQNSTIEYVVKLETSIKEANIQKRHLIAVFFDLGNVYETTWKFGISKDMQGLVLLGRMPNFIKSFLSDRKVWVRVGSTFSNLHKHKDGFSQGSIQSVTLFNIGIKQYYSVFQSGNWELPLCWRLLHHLEIEIYANCNNESRQLLIGQPQSVLECLKTKQDTYICLNWEKCTMNISSNMKIRNTCRKWI